jgi:hypothetical protein
MGAKLVISHKGKNRLRFFEEKLLRRRFGPNRDEVPGKKYIIRSSVVCRSSFHQTERGGSNQR